MVIGANDRAAGTRVFFYAIFVSVCVANLPTPYVYIIHMLINIYSKYVIQLEYLIYFLLDAIERECLESHLKHDVFVARGGLPFILGSLVLR